MFNLIALLLIFRIWEEIGTIYDTRTLSTETTVDPVAKLTKLKKTLDAGLITQDEFDKKKADILASM